MSNIKNYRFEGRVIKAQSGLDVLAKLGILKPFNGSYIVNNPMDEIWNEPRWGKLKKELVAFNKIDEEIARKLYA